MSIERIPIENRAQWLALRKFDLNASTIGALFNLHPYKSALRLYVEKQGLVDLPEEEDSAPKRRGRILEPAVAEAVREQRPNWTIAKCNEYFRDPDLGLAATPDYFIHGDKRGLGILQCKTAAPSVYEHDWRIDDSKVSVPFWIVLQATVELMLTGAAFAAVAVLVFDWKLECHIHEVPPHLDAHKKIELAAQTFWKDIERGVEPSPDYALDRSLLPQLMPHEIPGESIDLSTDNEIISGLRERAEIKARMKDEDDRCKAIEAMLMAKMKEAAVAIVPGFSVSWKVQHRKGYTVEPSEPRVLLIREKKGA